MKKEALRKYIQKIKDDLSTIGMSALSAWLFSALILALSSKTSFTAVPDFTIGASVSVFIIAFALCFALIFVCSLLVSKYIALISLPISFGVYGAYAVAESAYNANTRAYTAIAFCLLSLAMLAICVNYIKKNSIRLPEGDISSRLSFILVSVAFVLISAYFIICLWARTESFCSPCYDMGIFAQMYDNMTETLLPYTTCERGEHLSHFAVHFSPILYLLLPFCYIFEPTTVLVWAQILLVFSGVFPLWLICKRIGLSNIKNTVFCFLFLLYPALSSGAFYDFHENAFLTPLILWTLYFIHAEKWIPTFIFALSVLAVKEDAALYIGFIALYVIFSRKKTAQGILMLLMTFAYFLFSTHMLSSGGEGLMLGSRYYNIIGYEGSFTDLIKVALLNPALYAAEMLTPEKLLYMLNLLLPLGFLPLMTQKPSRWLMIAPMLVINLITDYQYQYDLGFQYQFGSGALLAYIAALNLADLSDAPLLVNGAEEMPEGSHRSFRANMSAFILALALLCSVFLGAARAPSHVGYIDRYLDEGEIRETVNETLGKIDRSKSVAANAFYLTPLYDVDELYQTSQAVENGEIKIYTDYVVLDLRPYISDSQDASSWLRIYMTNGYRIMGELHPDVIVVLERVNK